MTKAQSKTIDLIRRNLDQRLIKFSEKVEIIKIDPEKTPLFKFIKSKDVAFSIHAPQNDNLLMKNTILIINKVGEVSFYHRFHSKEAFVPLYKVDSLLLAGKLGLPKGLLKGPKRALSLKLLTSFFRAANTSPQFIHYKDRNVL